MTIHIKTVSIEGFRGFKDRQTISLAVGSRPLSVSLFGENGSGKSSLADAFEFFFTSAGFVERLGQKATENQAGSTAMVNVSAPIGRVTVEFTDGDRCSRKVAASGKPAANEIKIEKLLDSCPAPVVLRAADMKTFVADRKGTERYVELARWMGLQRLTALYDDLTRVERSFDKHDRSEARAEKLAELRTLTELTSWNEGAILQWVNTKLIPPVESELSIKSLGQLAQLDKKLAARATASAKPDDAREYRRLRSVLTADNDVLSALDQTALATQVMEDARKSHAGLIATTPAAEMRDVWRSVRALLHGRKTADCPACFRPWAGLTTPEATLERIDRSLEQLQTLADAESRAKVAEKSVRTAANNLKDALGKILEAAEATKDDQLHTLLAALRKVDEQVERWLEEPASVLDVATHRQAVASRVADAVALSSERIAAVDAAAPIDWSGLRAKVQRLRDLIARWNVLTAEENELLRVQEQYKALADFVRKKIQAHVTSVVKSLRGDVQTIYSDLRGVDKNIPNVGVEVADERKTMRVEIALFGKSGLPPSGYLSDSQLNSLGLALFIAAVRRFNHELRLVVLDDVMSSYDASHRLHLVDVIRKYLGDYQVVVTTHDPAFFRQVKSVLAGTGDWRFDRLGPWALERGVLIGSDCSPDEEIERRISGGELPLVVAGLVMESVESWLYDLCAQRKVAKFRINKDRSAPEPMMADLWSAAHSLLSEGHKKHDSYRMVSGHSLLNWSRHTGTAPMGLTTSEIGVFWTHFKKFRDEVGGGLIK